MGGKISLESQLGKGARFYFTLLLEKGIEVARDRIIDPIVPRSMTVRALIVDDSAASCQVTSDYFSAWGITNRVMTSGAAALVELRTANARGAAYQLVMLDEAMPGTSGSSIARAIKQDPLISTTKVVVMGHGDGGGASAPGIDGWLAKPVRPSHLFDCVHELFTFTEPSAGPLRRLALGSNGGVYQERRRALRVLVVEDNAVNQAVVARQLEALGFSATIVDDAHRGLEALAHESFNAVLLDCELPGMDGYAAAQEIRRREGDTRHTVVIALTAHATAGQRERCLQAGMDDFLSKPVRLSALAQALDHWTGVKNGDHQASLAPTAGSDPNHSEAVVDIDPQTLADIASLSANDGPREVQELVEAFLADLAERRGAIARAADHGDLQALADLAHRLGSAARLLGARHFAAICTDLEQRARSNEVALALLRATDLLVAADDLPERLRHAVSAVPQVA